MKGSEAIRVELGERSYDVVVGPGALDELCTRVAGTGARRLAVVADTRVAELHGAAMIESFREVTPAIDLVALPAGEEAKSLATVESTCRRILAGGFERADVVVGFGGGAATDVAGFVAAILLRGVRWASIPTTLLGQVDAAVGGKTGVNVPEGKNLVGAFHQPVAVACEPAFLESLPDREFRAGLAEVVKTAWIGDPDLFESMENDPPIPWSHPQVAESIRRCVSVKADVVSRDEREGGLRASLNFGHTIGHAIETESSGKYLHGEAVSLGLVAAVHLSVATDRCESGLLDRLIALLDRLGLPTRDPDLDAAAVVARTRADKKRKDGGDRYQLTQGLGFVSVARDLPEGAPLAAVEFLRR